MEPETPTLTTVARLANVSVASASRAMNGIKTTPETLARVDGRGRGVGYVPNAAARSLRSRRTGQIAFAMPDVANPVYTAMVASIQEVSRTGSRLVLHSTGGDADDELGDPARPQAAVRRRAHPRLAQRERRACRGARASAAVPVVVIGRPPRAQRRHGAPTRGAARREAVRHLHAAAGEGSPSSTARATVPGAGGGTATSTGCADRARVRRDARRDRRGLHGRPRTRRDRAAARTRSGPTRSSARTTCSRRCA